jgi:hypothetical protein
MKSMSNQSEVDPVQITNREAIALVRERAEKERRSLASAASVTIIEALSTKQNPGQPKFLDDVIVKGGSGESSEK